MFPELQQAFNQQSNYYRGLIALQCPLDSCKTRAQFFSEASVDSPIYDSRCDQLHQTTLLTDACTRVIQEYCTSNLNTPGFVDVDVCTSFVNTQTLFVAHNWNTECEQEINETKAEQYPIMSNICYYVVIEECSTNGGCPCILKRYVNDTHVQVIPCLFNECTPLLDIGGINTVVVILILIIYVMHELIYYQNVR
jgi:hypothetical protein